MNEELLLALEYLGQEKGIDQSKLIDAIEVAMVTAAKKVFHVEREDLDIKFDIESGDMKVYLKGEEVVSQKLGRIAAQTAKQVIMQKLREAEKETIYDEYKDRVGDVLTGMVHRLEYGDVIVQLDKAEAILPRSEQGRGESYRQRQKLKVYVLEVKKSGKPPLVIVSRRRSELIRRLFEIEVPEIQDKTVEIVAIAREAGERTKIAVRSNQESVDPVGSCVGMKGVRVKNIVDELGGEKIDIIHYSDKPAEYIKAALNPAQVSDIKIFKEQNKALVIVLKDQLSIAIGRHGQNVRLASQLTNWEIDVRSPEELSEESPLLKVKGIGPKIADVLSKSGYESVDILAKADFEVLKEIEGLGEKTAQKAIDAAKKYLKGKNV
ncbi:MAG: transcription termination factor NusA [Candidatus Kaelpia aquatica]|nr:transcription termination factor NusA [Candidatus Kaelpia aquatica]